MDEIEIIARIINGNLLHDCYDMEACRIIAKAVIEATRPCPECENGLITLPSFGNLPEEKMKCPTCKGKGQLPLLAEVAVDQSTPEIIISPYVYSPELDKVYREGCQRMYERMTDPDKDGYVWKKVQE